MASQNLSNIPDEQRRLITQFIESQMKVIANEHNGSAATADATSKLVLRGFEVREMTNREKRDAVRANAKKLMQDYKAQSNSKPAETTTAVSEPTHECAAAAPTEAAPVDDTDGQGMTTTQTSDDLLD